MVAILGILAAIVLPVFQSNVTEAKEAAAKDNLRILRSAIELYAAKHNGVGPGCLSDNTNFAHEFIFYLSMLRGYYISAKPKNPFNNLTTIQMIRGDAPMPKAATGNYGWIYKPATKDFRIDWPGTNKTGTKYYDY